MFRTCRKSLLNSKVLISFIQRKTFLTNDYKCTEAWNAVNSTPVFTKLNINDFYHVIEQNYTSKGVISAIDVDIFANSIKDAENLEELKDLLHKLRLSAETNNMLESTQYATVRNYLELGHVEELVDILKDPLNFGVFLDDCSANILLDKLLTSSNYELAAKVASLIMLQEEYSHDITCALCRLACYKYITGYTPPEPAPEPETKPKKVEEVKIRVKFLRNPYFDDHFDIKDTYTLSGKTLAWMSERSADNLNNNLQIIGWLVYKKYDKLLSLIETLTEGKSLKVYSEVLELLQKELNTDAETKPAIEKCISILSKVETIETPLEESLKIAIENAINKLQNNDISQQHKVVGQVGQAAFIPHRTAGYSYYRLGTKKNYIVLFKSWAKLRDERLDEQTKRLDRARRMQIIQEQQEDMKEKEQKLWFFENKDQLDLEIEKKKKLIKSAPKKKITKAADENYIPPEILPKK